MTTKLDSNYWGGSRRFGNMTPGNGGRVEVETPQPLPGEVWRPEGGTLVPAPGGYPGSEPGCPASGEPVDPNRGGRGI
jgi:hypothetical protein